MPSLAVHMRRGERALNLILKQPSLSQQGFQWKLCVVSFLLQRPSQLSLSAPHSLESPEREASAE